MAQVDLGKVRLTDVELSEKIIQTNGGVRFGKDADGNPGYVVTDADTGADTVIPFKSGGSGGLPITGEICFANTQVYTLGGGDSTYQFDLFNEPIEISKITSIDIELSIEWHRVASYTTSGLLKTMYFSALAVNAIGGYVNHVINSNYLVTASGNTNIEETNKKINISLDFLSKYKYLIGVGCNFYVYGGGNGSSYWLKTCLGSYTYPYKSKMDYVIS